MDHSIRLGSCTAQAVEIIKSAATHLCPGSGERIGRGIRAGEADDLMARADELGNDGGADPAGRAGYENTHEKTSWWWMVLGTRFAQGAPMSVAVINWDRDMTRWEPNARGRLEQAALALYGERGFENTTVAEIAARAGLTERTFFRHFADKREVLFAGGAHCRSSWCERSPMRRTR
jgi:hypothetical protein